MKLHEILRKSVQIEMRMGPRSKFWCTPMLWDSRKEESAKATEIKGPVRPEPKQVNKKSKWESGLPFFNNSNKIGVLNSSHVFYWVIHVVFNCHKSEIISYLYYFIFLLDLWKYTGTTLHVICKPVQVKISISTWTNIHPHIAYKIIIWYINMKWVIILLMI